MIKAFLLITSVFAGQQFDASSDQSCQPRRQSLSATLGPGQYKAPNGVRVYNFHSPVNLQLNLGDCDWMDGPDYIPEMNDPEYRGESDVFGDIEEDIWRDVPYGAFTE